ncbi:MAG: serine hydrolase, partial [Chloroflexi bacterium]|nr:serine hydrolase [Chloroflexota bacterium]
MKLSTSTLIVLGTVALLTLVAVTGVAFVAPGEPPAGSAERERGGPTAASVVAVTSSPTPGAQFSRLRLSLPSSIVPPVPAPPRVGSQTPTRARPIDLEPAIRELVDRNGGTFGVAVKNLATGQTVVVNGDTRFPTASLYKLFVMQEVVRQVSRGELSPNASLTVPAVDEEDDEPAGGVAPGETVGVGRALEAMITVSSNTAGVGLLRLVTRDRVNQTLAAAGLTGTRLGATVETPDEQRWETPFTTTPVDVLRFYELLAAGQLVDPSSDALMLDLLFRQERDDRIPADLPKGTPVAHKTGELPAVRH